MKLSILDFKWLPIKISINWCLFVPENCFILANKADPDYMPPYAALHQGFHCLSVGYSTRGIWKVLSMASTPQCVDKMLSNNTCLETNSTAT